MLDVALVGRDLLPFSEFIVTLKKVDGVKVRQINGGEELFALLGKQKIDVVVLAEDLADGLGLQFSRNLMKKQPLINCAIVSSLPPEQFHEETEGLGIFMQLPPVVTAGDAEKMMQLLDSIHALMNSEAGKVYNS